MMVRLVKLKTIQQQIKMHEQIASTVGKCAVGIGWRGDVCCDFMASGSGICGVERTLTIVEGPGSLGPLRGAVVAVALQQGGCGCDFAFGILFSYSTASNDDVIDDD
eukprot:superscaffoldBa00000261_g3299